MLKVAPKLLSSDILLTNRRHTNTYSHNVPMSCQCVLLPESSFFLLLIICAGAPALQHCLLGMEFSGRDSNGRRVMGLLPAKGLATTVDADKQFLWEVPITWSVGHLKHFLNCALKLFFIVETSQKARRISLFPL